MVRNAEMGVSPDTGFVVDAAELVRTEAANLFQGGAEAAMPTEEMLDVRPLAVVACAVDDVVSSMFTRSWQSV